MAMGSESPRLVTRGQETVPSHGDFGFQGQFLDPVALETTAVETNPVNRVSGGVQLALDWLSVTFSPEPGETHPGEINPATIEHGREQWRHDHANRIANPAEQAVIDDGRYQALMVERERALRGEVQLAVSLALDCDLGDWVPLDYGSKGYQNAIQGPDGARIDFDPKGRYDFNVTLPGKASRRVGADRMVKLLRYSLDHRGNARRIDVVIDDFTRTVSPNEVMSAIQGPDVVTKAKSGVRMDGFKPGCGEQTGITVYLGANSSRRKLRVYDKALESDGETDCIRWEMQERDEAAETLIAQLAYQPWQTVVPRRLVSFVDFRDYESHSEIEKRERLDWFKTFVGEIDRANVYLAKAVATVHEKIEWVRQTIAPTLAVLMSFWKGDTTPLTDIIADGKRRWKPRHLALLSGT